MNTSLAELLRYRLILANLKILRPLLEPRKPDDKRAA